MGWVTSKIYAGTIFLLEFSGNFCLLFYEKCLSKMFLFNSNIFTRIFLRNGLVVDLILKLKILIISHKSKKRI
jgi:hypothetical protein